jgi:nitrate reductase NapD
VAERPGHTAVHVSSLIVYLRPEAAERVAAAILRLGHAEIAARQEGKLVVVLEAEHEAVLADYLTKINLMPDVYVAALVYHQVDDGGTDAGGDEEEAHEAQPS